MQKLDFVKNLEVIIRELQSTSILHHFRVASEKPQNAYEFSKIIPILFQTKGKYDQLKNNDEYSEILSSINSEVIYSDDNLHYFTTLLTNKQVAYILIDHYGLSFFNFHNTLVNTFLLTKNVLLGESLNNDFQSNLENGISIFQIIIAEQGLETEKYIKIFTAFQELIEALSKIVGEEEQKSEIILLDSGSDTNVGIKSGIETAKSLYLIFKEIWDSIKNRKYYDQEKNNKALLESLSVRSEIVRSIKEGIISEDEGRTLTHLVKTRTDD